MRTLLAAFALAFIPFACGEDDEPVAATGPLVTYEHGGGIAASPWKLIVDRDGRATLTNTVYGPDGPKNELTEFDLESADLTTLEDQLAAAEGDTKPDLPGGCADCFTFSVVATGIDVDLDQVSIEEATPELGELVATLERLGSPPEPVLAGPLVVYEHGGGIASEPRRLVVEHDGTASLTVETGGDKSVADLELSEADLSALEDQLAAAEGDTDAGPSACDDCFTYEIQADGIDVSLDEISIDVVSPDLKQLVTTLERLSSP